MQQSLFDSQPDPCYQVDLIDGEVTYYPNWIAPDVASQYQQTLVEELTWRQDTIKMFGKLVKIPRLQSWHGEPHCVYQYSDLTLKPQPWTPLLKQIKRDCELCTGAKFNSVLANWYRDGQDSMGMHADDEPELGPEPVIASVTFGQTRPFVLKHIHTNEKHVISLEHGSLLIMAGKTQQYYHHGINKTKKALSDRINLTFRQIKHER